MPPANFWIRSRKGRIFFPDGHNELCAGVEGGQLVRVAAGVPLRQPGHPEAAADATARPVPIPPASNAAAAGGTRLRIQQARVGHYVEDYINSAVKL